MRTTFAAILVSLLLVIPLPAQVVSGAKSTRDSLPNQWRDYLTSPSMFGSLDSLRTNGRAKKVRGLVQQTLIVTEAATDLEGSDTIPERREDRRQDALLRASALWVGVRLESERAIRDGDQEAAKAVVHYLGDLRARLRDFPPSSLEGPGEKGELRTRLWLQAMSQFNGYEADAGASLGTGSNGTQGENPLTRASLWLLQQFGPYNQDDSAANPNANLMQESSDKFREVERLAKQAVAAKVQASVALLKVYGWPPRLGDGDPKEKPSVLATPSGLTEMERNAFSYTLPRKLINEKGEVQALDPKVVSLISLTAAGDVEGVMEKYARVRSQTGLAWPSDKNLFVVPTEKDRPALADSAELFRMLVQRFDHGGLWGNGLDWAPEAFGSWPRPTADSPNPSVVLVPGRITVGRVQSDLQKWIRKWPLKDDGFLQPVVLGFARIPGSAGAGSKEEWRLIGWPEQRRRMQEQWEAAKKRILLDPRFSQKGEPAGTGPVYVSLASHRLYELRKRIHELRQIGDQEGVQPLQGTVTEQVPFLRDSEFGQLRLLPLANQEEYLNRLPPEQQRLLLFRKWMAQLYHDKSDRKDNPQYSAVTPKAGLEMELSQRIAEYFILGWSLEKTYTAEALPPWAEAFLERKRSALTEILSTITKADSASESKPFRKEKEPKTTPKQEGVK